MLAYVFWHRPGRDADVPAYEAAQRDFHGSLEGESACFRLERLPFGEGPGYEDWYLVGDWAGLGELNASAVDAVRRPAHDRAAASADGGWGAVYALVRGPERIPEGAEWRDKPRGEPHDEFVAAMPETTVWQRQMVLGPAPEFCISAGPARSRTRVFPD